MKDYELVNKEFQEGTKVQGKYSLSSSEQDEKVQSAGKRAFLENNLEGNSGKQWAIFEKYNDTSRKQKGNSRKQNRTFGKKKGDFGK